MAPQKKALLGFMHILTKGGIILGGYPKGGPNKYPPSETKEEYMENILDILEGYLLLECTYEENETEQFNDVRFIDFYNKHSKIKHELCEIYKNQEGLFGGLHFIKYNDRLNIYHTFTKRLSNPGDNKKNLSEEDASLLNNIKYVVKKAKEENMKLYIPKYIGTTFSKAHWETLEKEIKNISEDIVFIKER